MFGARGPANVTIPDTKSLVVYGALTVVNGLPVYWYVVDLCMFLRSAPHPSIIDGSGAILRSTRNNQ
jgi:hypothetical protein